MLNKILLGVSGFILLVIGKLSYGGIVLLMGIESANIPLPSELIMPFAGYLVSQGKLNMHIAAFAGAIGCVIGSIGSYYLGYYGGRPFVEKYGKYFLLSSHDIEFGDRLFAKYGDKIAFISRVLPIIRTFISFPAGMSRMSKKKFILYSFVGSLLWSYLLVFIGEKIGKNQQILSQYFHKFDLVIELVILFALAIYLYTHIRKFIKKV